MSKNVRVAGVGMTTFYKPKISPQYNELGAQAVRSALSDAGIDYKQIEAAYVGYTLGDSGSGQRTLYDVGVTGIEITNVNNLCATGSTALMLARDKILGGLAECVLVLGFEQMPAGPMKLNFDDRTSAAGLQLEIMGKLQGVSQAPMSIQAFGGAALEFMNMHGVSKDTLAMIAVKARKHASLNPHAVFRDLLTVEEVLESKMYSDPLTKLQCSPPTCGAAAAVLCSEAYARRLGRKRGVTIIAQKMTSDAPGAFTDDSMVSLMGYGMAERAARAVYEKSSIGPEDIDVIELHDCYTSNELISYEALGLSREGEAEKMVLDGNNTYGGKYVVNPSGGLLAKGHPIGATGVAQCVELTWQLRGEAGERQVAGARTGLQHNIGPGAACVVTMYQSS